MNVMTGGSESTKVARIAAKLQGQLWITQDKIRHYPQDMTDRHLKNTVLMIADGRMAASGRHTCSGILITQWLQIFKEEIFRRERETP
jgi:hypothetical protein